MACEILIAAKDLNHSSKGYPKNVKDIPCVWGKKECPPGYVILRITDASASQVEHFLQQWHKKFAYTIINENEAGYRIKVEVDPALVSASGMNKEVRADMKYYIRNTWDAVIVAYDDFSVFVDIPKVDGVLDLQEVKDDIHDKFAEVIDHRFYYFDSGDVDNALTKPGGIVERTKAQVLTMIRSKLDD